MADPKLTASPRFVCSECMGPWPCDECSWRHRFGLTCFRFGLVLLFVAAVAMLLAITGVVHAQPPRFPVPPRFPEERELPAIDFRLPADLRLEREEVTPAAVPFGGSVTPTPARPAAPINSSLNGSFPAANTGTFARPAGLRGITDCPT